MKKVAKQDLTPVLIAWLLLGGAAAAQPAAGQVFVYGGDRSFPPYEYLDEEGRPAGFTVELVRALASQAQVRVEVRLGVWRATVAALEGGEVDFVTLARSAGREPRFAWLDRVWTLREALAYRPGRAFYPTQLEELAGETIAVEERSLMHELLQSQGEPERPVLITTESNRDALQLVISGQATAAAGSALTLQGLSEGLGRRLVIVDTARALPYDFATRPGHEAALAWLPPALAALRDSGRFHRLVERHLLWRPVERSWWDDVGGGVVLVGGGVVLILGILVWNLSLRRQVEAGQSAVERAARLQTVAAALGEALTPADVARAVVEQSVAILGASAGMVALRSPARPGRLEVVYSLGTMAVADEASPDEIPADAPLPLARAVTAAEAVLVETPEQLRREFPGLPIDSAQHPMRAMAAVPLTAGARTIGALGLSFGTERRFPAEDRSFLLALARQCAHALERARLFQAEKSARAAAEAANHAKDEFLATLSHELRTPINAIVGWTHMLRRGVLPAEKAARALETVERNAGAQMQLINDLLDVSRTVRGALHLDVQPMDLGACLQAALETVRPAAEARRIALIESVAESPPDFQGDPARLQQVLWNLLSNALKFTPPGGRVEVGLYYTSEEAVVRIADTGVGIEPSRLPYVFERFYQAEDPTSGTHGGLGLGLSIVRHLVELHGGTVTATSAGRDEGSTFTLRLPRRAGRAAARDAAAS